MDLISKFGITLISFGASILTAHFISSHKSFSFLSLREKRYGSLDGLRGFLSISVIFHHFIITWYWKVNGNWAPPPENYYQNYGRVSVALFFMITGLLFISKILREDGKTNWLKFYESRVFRIFPLYIFIIAIVSLIVFSASHFELRVAFLKLANQYINWGIFRGGIINDFSDTNLIIAGVVWTLKYEWTFYFFLPILAAVITKFKKVGSLFF